MLHHAMTVAAYTAAALGLYFALRGSTHMNISRLAVLVGTLTVASVSALQAQMTPSPLTDVSSAPAPVPYVPSMSDLMTSSVQPRHVKLSLAVHDENWTYATYEVSELRGAFKRIIRTIPVYDQKTNTEALMAMVMPPLDLLQAAIKAKDGPAAKKALTSLTATCNACHQQTLNRTYIVIVDPKKTAFPNQDFGRH